MTYTKKQFLEDVKKEAVALKENATAEELERLDFNTLDPEDYTECIYGQMTGSCLEERACELIFNCCARYVTTGRNEDLGSDSFMQLCRQINGSKIRGVDNPVQLLETREDSIIEHYSALEAYIMTPFAKNKNLIDFLKGNRKDLVL